MRVDRVSDARFERTTLLGFCERDERDVPTVKRTDNEMTHLHQHVFWRVDKMDMTNEPLPEEGDEVWMYFPEDKLYLVSK